MNTGWAPKPMRPDTENSLFPMVESPVIVKGLSPMQRQREADGTPHTRAGLTSLRPPDPELTLPSSLVKGSLVAKYDERPKMPKTDPEDPMMVVKSYLAFKSQADAVGADKEVSKSLETMKSAIQKVLEKTGAK